ncbi:DUF5808 domain-containing protein [Desulfosporosinus sp. FKA]|uniref:DUF5808 domain-containing protein n=1 Tax=Desulfosporosinus sp. FKA TaxID=1969834 RepID=UPI000B4A49D6|nr:DUF5808 domain-containing protein [Desulfosporosinus sp. FKA]
MAKRKWTDEEVDEYRRTHNQFLYFNPDDANFRVPKANGLGWTNNWAHPASGIIILAVLALAVVHSISK